MIRGQPSPNSGDIVAEEGDAALHERMAIMTVDIQSELAETDAEIMKLVESLGGAPDAFDVNGPPSCVRWWLRFTLLREWVRQLDSSRAMG